MLAFSPDLIISKLNIGVIFRFSPVPGLGNPGISWLSRSSTIFFNFISSDKMGIISSKAFTPMKFIPEWQLLPIVSTIISKSPAIPIGIIGLVTPSIQKTILFSSDIVPLM